MRAIALIIILMASVLVASAKTATVCRDAKTGKFVSAAYAKKYPGLTTCEKAK
jgi:hypothetical protein